MDITENLVEIIKQFRKKDLYVDSTSFWFIYADDL